MQLSMANPGQPVSVPSMERFQVSQLGRKRSTNSLMERFQVSQLGCKRSTFPTREVDGTLDGTMERKSLAWPA